MDYSELVYAIQEGDERTANRMCAEALPILKKYLISKVGASPEDAEDAVQRMFEYVIPKIQNGEIKSPTGLLAYMLSGSRHSFYKIVRDLEVNNLVEITEELVEEPKQVWKLVNEEKESVLLKCIQKLNENYRELILFLFDHPEANTLEISEHFEISENNAWTRKHRVLQQLRDCVKKYL